MLSLPKILVGTTAVTLILILSSLRYVGMTYGNLYEEPVADEVQTTSSVVLKLIAFLVPIPYEVIKVAIALTFVAYHLSYILAAILVLLFYMNIKFLIALYYFIDHARTRPEFHSNVFLPPGVYAKHVLFNLLYTAILGFYYFNFFDIQNLLIF